MTRVRDPLSEALVYFIIDCYRVWRSWLSTLGSDKANRDPIINDPVTDPVRVANLPDAERAFGRRRSRDLVFVAQPLDHILCERLTC